MEDNVKRRSFLRLTNKSGINHNDSLRRNSLDPSHNFKRNHEDILSPRVLARPYLNPKFGQNDFSDFDTSITVTPHELRDIMANSEKADVTLREMMDDSAATGIILKAKEPWRDVNSKLYYEFLESTQAHLSEPEVFNTVADFIQNCTDTLELMRGKNKEKYKIFA